MGKIVRVELNALADVPLGAHVRKRLRGENESRVPMHADSPDSTSTGSRSPCAIVNRLGQLTLNDSFRVICPAIDAEEATYNDWRPTLMGQRIDRVFASSAFDVVDASIERRSPGGIMASDHYPVVAILRWR